LKRGSKIDALLNEHKTNGRPTKYLPEYDEQAFKLCLLGCTIEEIARYFQVNITTIYEWAKKHSSFSNVLKAGREPADAEVASKLFQRANGFTKEVRKQVITKDGAIIDISCEEYFPPDTTAQIFWLKNRQRDKWRDIRHNELTGAEGGPIETIVSDAKALPDAELKEKLDLIKKRLLAEGLRVDD
jgi:hypothetical protein